MKAITFGINYQEVFLNEAFFIEKKKIKSKNNVIWGGKICRFLENSRQTINHYKMWCMVSINHMYISTKGFASPTFNWADVVNKI